MIFFKVMVYNIFELLVESAISTLLETVNRIENALETNRRLEKEFEHHVLLAFKGAGKEKGFDCIPSSTHGFPDIICKHKESGLKFGVEVKTGKTWQTNGNSIFTQIGEQDLDEIIVLFCKTTKPIEISWKKYEDAVNSIAITHSPRYVIKMDTENDNTFFKKMNITYKEFKKMQVEEKMQLIKSYYLLKEKGGRQWWMSKDK
ncbi:hypothetical protein [Rickettsia bellii]|uniref:Restriction endonuclease n=1 Tax=Rickettsia bellii str. RML An4 TaxID=1359193 RepID=A0A0F3QBG5_RICBE|nr:hypothetical protein [Rickettsia bellii]ABV78870.1 hypothetical protein A1I_02480 [Rickettsia bellii OSU 85-389]KJV89893.1 hypothetical protein RBEAN4_0882 [Rickettsia bellii str. RML An4]